MDALSRECLRRTPVQISLLLMLFELSGCHGEGFIGGYMSTPQTSWSGAVSSARLGPITCCDLSRKRIQRRPVLGGLINEYERVA